MESVSAEANFVLQFINQTNRSIFLTGKAGTGKTTLMREAISLMEKAGKQVTVVAPTAQASRGVLKEEGFEKAETVAKLLIDPSFLELILPSGIS